MKKQDALELKSFAKEIARRYSIKDREKNFNDETFEIFKIIPLSEMTAIVIFDKSSGKKAIAFFFIKKDKWDYFFPTDSHIIGMMLFSKYKERIEKENWEINFKNADSS